MGDEHEGDAHLALDGLQLDLHLFAQLGIERPERFIEQQHLRVVDQRPGQGHALPLATAELVGLAMPEAAQANRLEHLVGPRAPRRLAHLLHLQPVLHVLQHGHVRKQGVVLEHGVDIAIERCQPGDIATLQEDGACRRALEAGDHSQHGGLAAAGRAEQREELAFADAEIDRIDRDDFVLAGAERLAQADELNGGWSEVRHGLVVTFDVTLDVTLDVT